jgi:acetyltransferase-like isoleucine patch superfamily enzyme
VRAIKNVFGFLSVLPFLLLWKLRLLSVHSASILLGPVPLRLGNMMRRNFFKYTIGSCGDSVIIDRNVEVNFDDPRKFHIGEEVRIMGDCKFGEYMNNRYEIRLERKALVYDGCRIGAYVGPVILEEGAQLGFNCVVRGPLTMGKWCGIGHHATVVGFQHTYEDASESYLYKGVKVAGVVIEDEAWIGANVYIGSGVTIGKHSVVGAGSVVTKNIPPYSVAVGNPARVIKRYDLDKKEWMRVQGEPDKS